MHLVGLYTYCRMMHGAYNVKLTAAPLTLTAPITLTKQQVCLLSVYLSVMNTLSQNILCSLLKHFPVYICSMQLIVIKLSYQVLLDLFGQTVIRLPLSRCIISPHHYINVTPTPHPSPWISHFLISLTTLWLVLCFSTAVQQNLV